MPRSCTVCTHDERDLIEDAFIAGTPKRRIASHYGVTERAVRYHVREHLPALIALARDAERAARADTLLDRIEDLQSRTEAFLERVEETENYSAILGGFREMRANLELIGEVTKQLDRTPTLNLHLNPEWLRIETTIVTTLELFPDAREAVVGALKELPSGAGNA